VKSPRFLVTSTLSCTCWHMTQRESLSTTRSLTMHLEQASLCPQGPYAVNWIGSAQTAQYSSIGSIPPTAVNCFREREVLVQTLWHAARRFISDKALVSTALNELHCASNMSAFSCHTAFAQSCKCNSAFWRERHSQPSRKPLLCRALSDETQRLANDQQIHREHLSRRQAILSAAAVIVLPTLSLPASAKAPTPPPGKPQMFGSSPVSLTAC